MHHFDAEAKAPHFEKKNLKINNPLVYIIL
jgi:hypothetical protein